MAFLPIGPQGTQEHMFHDGEMYQHPASELMDIEDESFAAGEPEQDFESVIIQDVTPETVHQAEPVSYAQASPQHYPDAAEFAPSPAVEHPLEQEAIRQELPGEPSGEIPFAYPPAHLAANAPEPVAAQHPVSTLVPTPASAPEPALHPAAATMPLTADDFADLEDRVLRAVSLVRRERAARAAAEARVALLEAQLLEQPPLQEQIDRLTQEVDALRGEREQVRNRVERLLGQLDALEL
jgi:hypothetical protein